MGAGLESSRASVARPVKTSLLVPQPAGFQSFNCLTTVTPFYFSTLFLRPNTHHSDPSHQPSPQRLACGRGPGVGWGPRHPGRFLLVGHESVSLGPGRLAGLCQLQHWVSGGCQEVARSLGERGPGLPGAQKALWAPAS